MLEGELEAMGQSEDFELIDENKKAYDEVVEELKKGRTTAEIYQFEKIL